MSFRVAASAVAASTRLTACRTARSSAVCFAAGAGGTAIRPLNPASSPVFYRSLHASSSTWKKGAGGSKKKQLVDPETPEEVDDEKKAVEEKAKARMSKAVEWVSSTAYEAVERIRGSASPALLDGVKLQLPDETAMTPLKGIASITTRQHTLWVEVYDPKTTKLVESAINSANLPGLHPQRVDETTLKIPVTRPTAEIRSAMLKQLLSDIENAKNQVRGARTDGVKALGGQKDPRSDDVLKLGDTFGGKLDDLTKKVKQEFAKP